MQRGLNSTYWGLWIFLLCASLVYSSSNTLTSLQEDGSLVVFDAKGSVADFVKQGTPRQSIQIGGQNCNVSYGFNSAGKKTILVSVPALATGPAVFDLGENQITIPPKSALRITLGSANKIEKMDSNPAETVRFTPATSRSLTPETAAAVAPTPAPSPAPTQLSPVPEAMAISAPSESPSPSAPLSPEPDSLSSPTWPGKLLEPPLAASQIEEDQFYARTEFGPRFMSAMNLVSVSGPDPTVNAYNQKKIAFSTGYRQDISAGVWLTEWFGLAVETGFALNAVRGNTQGMTVSCTTFWTVPLLAQLCFQYPNDSGWIPYINLGFGGGWTIFKVGGIDYTTSGGPVPSLSGTGNSVNNAYQIAAGVRYRLYEELSLTMAYKFYGNSQANMNLDNGVQITLGSPVTQAAEVGLNFSF
jgi:opacity protein-like surface antigen